MKEEQDRIRAKHWLRELRAQSGLTQKTLAELVGRDPRVVLNAESENAGWPGGFTLLRMLQELGAVQDAPAPADSPLARLEEKLDGIALTLDDLAAFVRDQFPESNREQGNGG